MNTNEDIMRALGSLEAQTKAMASDIQDVKTYAHDVSKRIGSLERSRAALWTGLVVAKTMIAAGFAYFAQRGSA